MESNIERKLVQGVKCLGGLCLKWTSPSFTGVPDRIVFMPKGKIYLVETKADKGTLSHRQMAVMRQLAKLGTEVHIVRGDKGLQGFLEEIDGR